MKIVFDSEQERQEFFTAARDSICPDAIGLHSLETCRPDNMQYECCGKCWEKALKDIVEVAGNSEKEKKKVEMEVCTGRTGSEPPVMQAVSAQAAVHGA